jgi:hypothetical protein
VIASVHSRRRESTQCELTPRSRPSSVTHALGRTMLSKPLANSSTLDRGRAVAQLHHSSSYVEELWSPALLCRLEICRQKPTGILGAHFLCMRHRGTFLSQAGPRARLIFLKLSITSLMIGKRGLKRRRRPPGSPSLESHYGSTPSLCASSESRHVPGPAVVLERRLHTRQPLKGRPGGFGAIRVDVGVVGHTRMEHRRSSGSTQWSPRNYSEVLTTPG